MTAAGEFHCPSGDRKAATGRAREDALNASVHVEQAASLAAAALRDTLEAVALTPAGRRVLVFEGNAEPWRPPGFDVIPQRGVEFGERLQAAFDDAGAPALLIGMDTPQLTPARLTDALAALSRAQTDAVLGPTEDGGYWCVGFQKPAKGAFSGVAMSSNETYLQQRRRLFELGLRVGDLPLLRDVDTIADARAVAAAAPQTRFARVLSAIA